MVHSAYFCTKTIFKILELLDVEKLQCTYSHVLFKVNEILRAINNSRHRSPFLKVAVLGELNCNGTPTEFKIA